MALRKKNFLYTPEDYYEIIKQCRQNDKFNLYKMKCENFISTKYLENAIQKRKKKNTEGKKVNWLKICWLRFCKSAPYTISYKTSMEDTEFKTLDLSPTVRGRPPKFERIALKCFYINARPITHEKYKDMMLLLPYIPPVHHKYFKTLPHNEPT